MQREQFKYEDGYETFLLFTQRHPQLFVKRAISWGGEGAYKIDVSTLDKAKKAWKMLNGDCVIEELINNCDEISHLYSGSLNTIKVVTLWINNKPEIQTAMFRMGNNTVVDNVHLGGICALVDINTGIVTTKALDKHFREYVRHPVTNEKIVGFVIPKWKEVIKLAKKAASITPEMRYSSWDIAVTNSGPILIEGNWDAEFYPEQMLLQKGIKIRYCDKLKG